MATWRQLPDRRSVALATAPLLIASLHQGWHAVTDRPSIVGPILGATWLWLGLVAWGLGAEPGLVGYGAAVIVLYSWDRVRSSRQ